MFTNKQKTRVMNAVSGYGFHHTKQIKWQSPKDWNDLKLRIAKIKSILREIDMIESNKFATRTAIEHTTINEDVQCNILETFDTLMSIKKVMVSEMISALLDYQDEVEFTTRMVYIDHLNENLFNVDYENYSLLDNIRTYW